MLKELAKVSAAANVIRQSATPSHIDVQAILAITSTASSAFTMGMWMVDLIYLHGKMQTRADKDEIDEMFKSRVSFYLEELDGDVTSVNQTTGLIQTAGVAVQATAVSAHLTSLQKILSPCR